MSEIMILHAPLNAAVAVVHFALAVPQVIPPSSLLVAAVVIIADPLPVAPFVPEIPPLPVPVSVIFLLVFKSATRTTASAATESARRVL